MSGGRLVPCAPVSEPQTFEISERTEAPLHGDEITILRGMLAFQRDTLRWKCAGLTQDHHSQPVVRARRRHRLRR